jgi:hypothetical protein
VPNSEAGMNNKSIVLQMHSGESTSFVTFVSFCSDLDPTGEHNRGATFEQKKIKETKVVSNYFFGGESPPRPTRSPSTPSNRTYWVVPFRYGEPSSAQVALRRRFTGLVDRRHAAVMEIPRAWAFREWPCARSGLVTALDSA